MRRSLVLATLAVLALGLGPARAGGGEPTNTECLIGPNVVAGDDGTIGAHCEFLAQDLPGHGYLGATANQFRVYAEAPESQNNAYDEGVDTLIVNVEPSAPEPSAGSLELDAGVVYDVDLINGCVEDPACGWAGALLVI